MSLTKKIFFLLMPLLVLALVLLGLYVYLRRMPEPMVRQMSEPTWLSPLLVSPGDSFDITLDCEAAPEIERVVLNSSVDPEEIEYKLKVENLQFSKEKKHAVITARVPKIILPSLYDVSVWYREGDDLLHDLQANSLSVQPSAKDTFTFAVVSQFAFRTDVDNPAERRRKIIALFEELNLLNPDFVVVTGGVSETMWTGTDDAATIYSLVESNLFVPLFIVPNENDLGAVTILGHTLRSAGALWRKVSHKRHFQFDYMDFDFIGIDTYSCANLSRRVLARKDTAPGCVSDKELAWLESRLETAARAGRQVVLFTHHSPARDRWVNDQGLNVPVFDTKSQKKLLKLINRRHVSAVFSGHVQRDTMQRVDGGETLFVTTGSGNNLTVAQQPAMRLVTVENGKLTADSISYVNKPASMPLGKVTATYKKNNDGSAASNTITVNNGLKRPLNNMQIIAIMSQKKDHSDFLVQGDARVLQTNGTTYQFVFLNFDLEPGAKRVFEIK